MVRIMTVHRPLVAAALALFTLLSSGCERVFFGVVNHDVPTANATVVYAPDRGLALDVFRPHGSSSPAPTLVFFYGGAWKRGNREQYRFVGHRLAEHGVLAIVADYRTWPRAGFPAFMEDAADAVAWARVHAGEYGGDPQRLFVAGHSAGAQIAGLLGTDAHYLAGRGIKAGQLSGVIGLSGPYDFKVGPTYASIFGAPSQWPKAQVVNFVDGDEPPFLLVHGDADRTVEVHDSVELAGKLRDARVPVTLLLLPGAGHMAPMTGLYAPRREPMVLPAMLDFIRSPATPAR
jgi:acetyl esterase/lipase